MQMMETFLKYVISPKSTVRYWQDTDTCLQDTYVHVGLCISISLMGQFERLIYQLCGLHIHFVSGSVNIHV